MRVIALSTGNLPSNHPADRVARLLRLGADGLALGPHARDRDLLAAGATRGRTVFVAVLVPSGLRICAPDRHELREAIRVAEREIDRANRLECSSVVIDLGALDAGKGVRWPDLLDAFARGRLDRDVRDAFIASRRVLVERHLNATRRSLDTLLPLAEKRGSTVGLLPAASGDALGLADENDTLLRDYDGAPLAVWRATDREHRLRTLSLATAKPPAGVAGAIAADAAGLAGGLPPGSAEVDWSSALAGSAPEAPCVLQAELATEGELARALEFLRGLPRSAGLVTGS